jgi:hypothetical protein
MENDWLSAAKSTGHPGYIEAVWLYKEAVREFEPLYEATQAANLRVLAALFQARQAAESLNATLEDEISVAPACKCDCKGS